MPRIAPENAALLKAVGDGKLDEVRALLASGSDPCALDESNTTYGPQSQNGIAAIHLAMNARVPNAIAELLVMSARDINVKDDAGNTPLHHVMDRNRAPTRAPLVQKLLLVGADPQATNDVGNTPIFDLVPFNEPSDELAVIDLLVEAGARVDHVNLRKETLLDWLQMHAQRGGAKYQAVIAHVSAPSGPALAAGTAKSDRTTTLSVAVQPFARSVTVSVYVPAKPGWSAAAQSRLTIAPRCTRAKRAGSSRRSSWSSVKLT